MPTYDDFFVMADAILAHVAANQSTVAEDSDAENSQIGFRSTPDGELFRVTLETCRLGSVILTDAERASFLYHVRTTAGRALMAAAFNRGESIWKTALAPTPAPE